MPTQSTWHQKVGEIRGVFCRPVSVSVLLEPGQVNVWGALGQGASLPQSPLPPSEHVSAGPGHLHCCEEEEYFRRDKPLNPNETMCR